MILAISCSSALASPANYTYLKKGEISLWDAWCFDKGAIAEIIVSEELKEVKCQLKLDNAAEKIKADYDLKYEKLKIRMDYEINTRQASIDALIIENGKLEKTIINNEKYGWISPFIIGVISTAATAALIGVLVSD
jgi:hypothetical protein